jgi:hypothetical protein
MSSPLVMPERRLMLPSGVRATVVPPPAADLHRAVFSEEDECRTSAWESLGDLDDIEFAFKDVLVLKHVRSMLSENLHAPAETQREDRWQGAVGLVLKVGPTAFQDDSENKIFFHGWSVKRGDWVWYRNSDGWDQDIQELYGHHRFAACRILQDAHIRGRLKYPGRVMTSGI